MNKELTIEKRENLEDIGRLIVDALKSADAVFEIDGTPTLTVLNKEGEYRKKPMMAGWEFAIHDSYVGQLGKIVFRFSPLDDMPFDFVEVMAHQVDNIFPLMGGQAADALKLEPSNPKGEKIEGTMHVVNLLYTQRQEAEERLKIEDAKRIETNENWGIF